MRDEIIKYLSNLDIDETEPVYDGLKRFVMCHDFNIIINGVTIFFDGSNIAELNTYIEIGKDMIAFRTEMGYSQTTFAIFSYEDIKSLEFNIDDDYYYFGDDD